MSLQIVPAFDILYSNQLSPGNLSVFFFHVARDISFLRTLELPMFQFSLSVCVCVCVYDVYALAYLRIGSYANVDVRLYS